MKVLVIGINGMAGHTIATYLNEKGYSVEGIARNAKLDINTYVADCKDVNIIKKIIRDNMYDVVINCVGLLNACAETNKDEAIFINAYFPNYLAKITKDMDTKIIQISTDCVFSGKRGHYIESDITDGETVYAKTKAMGELCDGKNITIRTSIIGPDINREGIGLFNWYMKNRKKGDLNGYEGSVWTGVTSIFLAQAIDCVIHTKLYGIYHLVNNIEISKYELIKKFDKYFNNNYGRTIPIPGIVHNKSLVDTRREIDIEVPEYDIMIHDMKCWIERHIDLYPEYKSILK